jgi:hypothetical protein
LRIALRRPWRRDPRPECWMLLGRHAHPPKPDTSISYGWQ